MSGTWIVLRSSTARPDSDPRSIGSASTFCTGSGVGPFEARSRRCRPVDQVHRRDRRVAQARGALGDRVEHRLHVGRRARDHAQDLADRRLLVERVLRLVEEAHVVDRDRRLAREGLQQRDLVGRERPLLAAPEQDRTRRRRLRASAGRRAACEIRTRCWIGRTSGYSVSISGRMSGTWIVVAVERRRDR